MYSLLFYTINKMNQFYVIQTDHNTIIKNKFNKLNRFVKQEINLTTEYHLPPSPYQHYPARLRAVSFLLLTFYTESLKCKGSNLSEINFPYLNSSKKLVF